MRLCCVCAHNMFAPCVLQARVSGVQPVSEIERIRGMTKEQVCAWLNSFRDFEVRALSCCVNAPPPPHLPETGAAQAC